MYFIKVEGNTTLDPISGFISDQEMHDPSNACEAINRLIERETQHMGIRPEFHPLMTHGDTHIGHIVVHTKDMVFADEEWILINAVPVMTLDEATEKVFKPIHKGARHA